MKSSTSQSGFAMLYTVLLVSLILTIAVAISNLTLKQSILSNLAKDSGIAFYQADAAVECGMYQDTSLGKFPLGATIDTNPSTDVPNTFACGHDTMMLDLAHSYENYYTYSPESPAGNKSCFDIIFDKTNVAADPVSGYARVAGNGFNLCADNPRRVERTLEVKY